MKIISLHNFVNSKFIYELAISNNGFICDVQGIKIWLLIIYKYQVYSKNTVLLIISNYYS